MTKIAMKIRLTPGSDVALALRDAKREGAPVDFQEGEATYRFIPDTTADRDATAPDGQRGWIQQPTAEDVKRRQALAAEILVNRKDRVISPYSTADLVHAAREKRDLHAQ